ncbi:MAG: HEAT repeat domain-containing protein [Planctomycetota bacterium]
MRAALPTPGLPLLLVLLLVLPATSCQDTSLLTPCRELVAAPPADWPVHWRAVHALGPRATESLVHCLRENRNGSGRQAAIHLLGERRRPAAASYLRELVQARGADATEAALALGKLPDHTATGLLVTTVQNQDLAIGTRTAAACALLDLDQPQHAVPLMRAVLLAATPYGSELEREHGLPRKTRWAYERYMVIEAVRRFSNGNTFGLDEDAPWPQLRDGSAAFTRYVEQRRGS